MFEHLLRELPESVLACRRLYDAPSGGYRIPPRDKNRLLALGELGACRARYVEVQYDCIEAPVADLLYSLIVNTGSRAVLETGTSRGFSTCHLAAGAKFDGGDAVARVVTIDAAPAPHPFFENSTLAETIEMVRADSLSLDPAALLERQRRRSFDFMFFDSLHTYHHLSGELAHYLPWLKLGGLFALHDTFVFDDLGLVVLAAMQHRCIEAVSLPTHRRHAEGLRSPGVSLFRKIAPIGSGELRFPDLGGLVEGERQALQHPQHVVRRTGALFADARYVAYGMAQGERAERSPALLDPQGADARAERVLLG